MAITITIADLRKLIKERADELRLRKFIRKEIKSVLTEQVGMEDDDAAMVSAALAGDMAAADELVAKYAKVLSGIANRVARKSGVGFDDTEDLKASAMEYFLRAIRKWDPASSPLGAYIRRYVGGSLTREVEKMMSGASGSDRKTRAIRVGKAAAERKLRKELGREPTADEVAAKLSATYGVAVTAEDITTDLYKYLTKGVSANAPMGSEDDGSQMLDKIVQPLHPPQDVMVMQKRALEAMQDFRDTLASDEDMAVYDVIVGDASASDVAEMIGATRQTVYNKAKKLRSELERFLNNYGVGAGSLDAFGAPTEAELMAGM
jgi:RNA polymerase sigma factor (sigma-70 family)